MFAGVTQPLVQGARYLRLNRDTWNFNSQYRTAYLTNIIVSIMGKLNTFEIALNNPQGVYNSGQILEGYVVVDLNKEMTMRAIRLHLYGGADVRWTENHTSGTGKNRKTVTKIYSATETYINYVFVLFGKAPHIEGDNQSLPAGRHTYPFQYQLPVGIPSSFEGTVGRVRYWLSGTIDKPWKFDHTTKKAFTVINPLDLNTEPGSMDGIRGEGQKTLCCLCCKSGPISCTFQIDRCGYVPGETIPIKGEIINQSSRRMKRSYAQLYMVSKGDSPGAQNIKVRYYHATRKSRSDVQKIAEISRGEILPGDTDIWDGDPLLIPPVPPSKLPGCRIIALEYFIKLCVEPAGPGFQLEIPLGVIIGSIPLRYTLEQYGLAPVTQDIHHSQLYKDGRPSSTSPLPSMPPSYAESVFGPVSIKDEDDDEHTKGNMNFTPVYTFYSWGERAAQPSAPPP